MPLARTARRLAALIASGAPITAIIGHTHTMCRITDFTGRGVGPTLDVLGGGDRGTMFRSTCESCRGHHLMFSVFCFQSLAPRLVTIRRKVSHSLFTF